MFSHITRRAKLSYVVSRQRRYVEPWSSEKSHLLSADKGKTEVIFNTRYDVNACRWALTQDKDWCLNAAAHQNVSLHGFKDKSINDTICEYLSHMNTRPRCWKRAEIRERHSEGPQTGSLQEGLSRATRMLLFIFLIHLVYMSCCKVNFPTVGSIKSISSYLVALRWKPCLLFNM